MSRHKYHTLKDLTAFRPIFVVNANQVRGLLAPLKDMFSEAVSS